VGITLRFEDNEGIPDLDIGSASWGAHHAIPDRDAGTRRAQVSDVALSRNVDRWSAALAQAVSQGRRFAKITIIITKKDSSPTGSSSMSIVLTDVMITSYQSGRGDPPQETFGLSFTKMEYNRDLGPGDL